MPKWTMSDQGLAELKVEEGERLTAYKDTVGVWTIGVGHTGRMTPPAVVAGMKITAEQSTEYLRGDLKPVVDAVNKLVKVPITQSMFDALCSFAFNVGTGGLGGSTLLKKLNAGDYGKAGSFAKNKAAPGGWDVKSAGTGAAGQFLAWRKQKELTGRRIREQAQFLRDGLPGKPA
jgi:lysozyme